MKIIERYASAVRSSNLEIDERTTRSDSDVLGSMGLAARGFPLAVALQRLFTGDNTAAREVVEILADDAWHQARGMRVNGKRVRLNRVEAYDLAQACLAWHRNPTCRPCGGHGSTVIPGTKTLGAPCTACKGDGRMPFKDLFEFEHRDLADWLIVHMEKHQSQAGPEAMKWISDYIDLKRDIADQAR